MLVSMSGLLKPINYINIYFLNFVISQHSFQMTVERDSTQMKQIEYARVFR